jgi:hypothetical protein
MGIDPPQTAQNALEVDFNPRTIPKLLEALDNSTEIRHFAAAALLAAIGAPAAFAKEFFVRLRDATQHPELMDRDIAISAIAYPGWPEFRPVLRDVARNDPA